MLQQELVSERLRQRSESVMALVISCFDNFPLEAFCDRRVHELYNLTVTRKVLQRII